MSHGVRAIAFYLPQFHPIPENDAWWGMGFTEWTNVTRAQPRFPGHYQPHLPADLGFYDLRLPEARAAQATLAQAYGISGFCWYHYWFNGRRILERPFSEVLSSGKPDFPFCLCWANEDWTRGWDGKSKDTLLAQDYSAEDDRRHIRSLLPAFSDPRYIRVDGRPLFLVYRTESLPRPAETASIWREEVEKAGLGGLYLARVESFDARTEPDSIGFDAAVEFAPDWRRMPGEILRRGMYRQLVRWGAVPENYFRDRVCEYEFLVDRMLRKPEPGYPLFRCVSPGFDNSPRRAADALILIGSSPELFQAWVSEIADRTRSQHSGEQRLMFVNAWNEWAEGNHLEPDRRFGRAYLEALANGLRNEGERWKPLERQPPSNPFYRLRNKADKALTELRALSALRRFERARGELTG